VPGVYGGNMNLYLAIPYSSPSGLIRLQRFHAANDKAAELMRGGHIVYSPISMSHAIDLGTDFEAWEAQDKAFIDWCDAVYVNMISGWDTSIGVTEEIRYAKSLGKQIIYSEDEITTQSITLTKEA